MEISKDLKNRDITELLKKELYFNNAISDCDLSLTKEHKLARGLRNLAVNEDKLKGWTVKSPYHAQLRLKEGLIDWWFTRNKWQYKGKMYYGSLPNWIKALIEKGEVIT